MGPTGRLVTIKRSGVDGPHFPLSLSTCLFGRGIECDIRIQLPVVSKQHCKIEVSGQEATLFNFSSTCPTQVNGAVVAEPVQLKHGDVITIVDRSFRYENESHRNGSESTESPGQKRKQDSLHRVSRSSFSSDPDGKVQDSNAHSKLCEENVSGSPLVHVKNGKPAAPDGPKDHAARKSLNAVRSSELPGENFRNAMDPTARDFKEDSSVVLVSCHGELKTFPSTWCPENSENQESPFRELYESMKEEFDMKSGKGNVPQSGKKSGPQSPRASENECSGELQDRTQVLVSRKSRPRSGRFTPVKADPALGEQGISQTEDRRKDEEALQTPKETTGPSVPPKEMTRTETPVHPSSHHSSRKRRSEDLRVPRGSEPVNPAQRDSFGTDNKTLTPWKFLARNPTPTKVENADNFGATPEKRLSKKRARVPSSVDVLASEPETQTHTVLAPLPVQVERKIQSISVHQPERGGATTGPSSSGFPGRSSVDSSSSGDSINKIEGTPLKRRRVSFGGRLKPELFDENLPPNTPLKRGETPRRSLISHTPAVLKKIIKEYPQPSRKEDSSEIHLEVCAQDQRKGSPARNLTRTSPVANDTRRRSSKVPSLSRGSASPHPTDTPKRGGRKSGTLPSKRASIDRSQHEILQRIYSRRRSGASEANLIVAKSWADVVKLGAKQTQAKVVKHGPQRQPSKRPKRTTTPKKPVSNVHSQFSTGHANSPCTIIIGKAHIEKVHVPARPYRMLNNLVFNKKIDFNEDLSGLTEMFKTPAKKKPQTMSPCPKAFSNSEDFIGKEFEVPNSGEKPPLCTSVNFGENVLHMTQSKPQEPSDHSPASPPLRRPAIRVNANIEKTPGSEAEPLKAASSANRFRRSTELRNTQMPGPSHSDEEANTDTAENTSGRRLRKTPQRGQKPEGATEERESCFDTCEKAIKSEGSSEKMVAVRRSRRYSEQRWDPIANLTTLKRQQDTEPKEDLGGIQNLPQTPTHAQEPMDVGNKTTEKCQKSSKPELVGMPARMNVELKTPPQKVDLEEEPSALRKSMQRPGENIPVPGEPEDGDEDIKLFNRTPKQKVHSTENVTGSKRRSRTPKRNAPSLEDLVGLRELFQTPNHTERPRTDSKTTKVPCKSPLADPVNMPTSRKRQFETPPQKADLEKEPSALRKPTRAPGESIPSHGEPGGSDEDIKLLNRTPKQEVHSAENVTGSKRRSRTPKRNAPSLEDLVGLRELFQTPNHTERPRTDSKTTKVPCKSPLADPVNTPTSRKRQLETPLQKVDLEEESSALRKPTRTPRKAIPSHREPGSGDEDIRLFKETLKQKMTPAENVTGSKRRSRTPKKMVQSLEELEGLKELFQTPEHTQDPVTDDRTTTLPCKSPLADRVNTPTSRRRQLKTPPQKVDIEEKPSALRKSTQMSGESVPLYKEPGDGDEDIRLFNRSPKQKVHSSENVTGSKRRSRTLKKMVLSLEDLAGLRELFQTPNHTDKPMTNDKTTKVACKSPLADPVNTPTSKRRQLKTPPLKGDLEKDLRKPTQTPGESTHSHGEPGSGDEDIKLFKETPKQKMTPAENVTGSKRRSRTSKRNALSLEDLAGLRELFQTPEHTQDPVTDNKTTEVPCKSPLADPVHKPTSRRQLKTPPQKVDLEEEPSALRKSMQRRGENIPVPGEPEDGDEDTILFNRTPKQEVRSAENVTRSKRRSRTPKRNAPSLEDLVGLRELFQTPNHTERPRTDSKTTKVPCKSPLADPVNTPTCRKRQFETLPQKADLEKEPSALRKPTRAPGESIPSHGEPGGSDEDIKLLNRTPKQEVHSAENVTGSKRRSRTPKRNAPSLEDLAGLRELFQTPNHTEKLMADDKTTTVPGKSPLADPVSTPMSKRRRLRSPPQKVDLEEEPSALRKSTRTLGESAPSHREPGGGGEDIRLSKETPRKKPDHVENVSRSKKGIRTGKEKAQFLEDLVGFKELFQSPEHTREPAALVKSTVTLGRSPLAETVNTAPQRKTHRKMPQGTADSERKHAPLGEPIQMPAEATRTHREPGGAEAGIRFFKETPKQKMDPAENVTGSKRRSRTPKRNAPSLEDLAGLRELFQSPERPQHPVTDDKTAVPGKSPLADPVHKPMSRRRRLKTSPQKVDLKQEPSAPRKSTRTRGAKAQSGREAGGPEEDLELLGKPVEQEGPSAENGAGSKRGSRTSKRNAPSLALAGLREHSQTPEHAQDPVTDDKTTPVPGKSPLADAVHKPTSRRRQVKTLPQQADVGRGPSALRTSTRRRGPSVVSSQEPAGSDRDLRCVNDAAKQTLSPAENGMLRKSRRRAPKEKATPLEDLAGSPEPEPSPGPDPSEDAGEDEGGVRAAPMHPPGQRQAVSVPQRSLRTRRATAQEDRGLRREPVRSGREGGASPPSKREGGTEEGSTGAKRLRSATPAQDAEEEKPPQKRRRAAPQEGCDPPEPLTVKKRLRVAAEPMCLPGDPPRSSREATPQAREAASSPPSHQGRSLRSRRPNKTEAEEQRPEPVVTATEKPKTKRSDKKPLKTSQETALQSPEDGAKQAASGGKARESRMCLRSARPTRMPSPDVAEEKQREKRVGVQEKKQEEEVRQPSDPMRLRSRKITVPPGGKALESEPQQRVTRNAKRCAENIKKDDDNVCIKKLRTRSRRDNEDI
ncbi:proliferation marker protein Ki-67 isoform X3 [Mustela erminea]|uniref:proliferation marker protein Ki-67 isoform X3 n=1 Tax=Mustela erminea TaxID=36723 RepID=UPI00138750A4|nr:proliferation marker protein Ki-67 isoform X3 [Mustela erminea]